MELELEVLGKEVKGNAYECVIVESTTTVLVIVSSAISSVVRHFVG